MLKRLAKRTYNVQAIQGGTVVQQRTRMERNRIENKAAMQSTLNQYGGSLNAFGKKYVSRMIAFNALPTAAASLRGPLQGMITHGPPALQKAILHAVGVKPGLGAARLLDTMIQGGTGKIPGLNWGSEALFLPFPASGLPGARQTSWFDSTK